MAFSANSLALRRYFTVPATVIHLPRNPRFTEISKEESEAPATFTDRTPQIPVMQAQSMVSSHHMQTAPITPGQRYYVSPLGIDLRFFRTIMHSMVGQKMNLYVSEISDLKEAGYSVSDIWSAVCKFFSSRILISNKETDEVMNVCEKVESLGEELPKVSNPESGRTQSFYFDLVSKYADPKVGGVIVSDDELYGADDDEVTEGQTNESDEEKSEKYGDSEEESDHGEGSAQDDVQTGDGSSDSGEEDDEAMQAFVKDSEAVELSSEDDDEVEDAAITLAELPFQGRPSTRYEKRLVAKLGKASKNKGARKGDPLDKVPLGKLYSSAVKKMEKVMSAKLKKKQMLESEEVASLKRKRTIEAGPASKRRNNIPNAADSIHSRFFDTASLNAWVGVLGRKLHIESRFQLTLCQDSGMADYFKFLGLAKMSVMYKWYNYHMVKEFYANLKKDCAVKTSVWFGKVYVRDTMIEFSPQVINQTLGWTKHSHLTSCYDLDFCVTYDQMAFELTGGFYNKWPKRMEASHLTCRYYALYSLGNENWLPSHNSNMVTKRLGQLLFCVGTNTPVSLGHVIFRYMIANSSTTYALSHPCLITNILSDQKVKTSKHDEILGAEVCKAVERSFRNRIQDFGNREFASFAPEVEVPTYAKCLRDVQTQLDVLNHRIATFTTARDTLLKKKLRLEAVSSAVECCPLSDEDNDGNPALDFSGDDFSDGSSDDSSSDANSGSSSGSDHGNEGGRAKVPNCSRV